MGIRDREDHRLLGSFLTGWCQANAEPVLGMGTPGRASCRAGRHKRKLREREAVRAGVVRTEPVREAAVTDGDRAERPLDVLDEYFAAC